MFTDPGKTEIAHVPAPGAPRRSRSATRCTAAIDWPIRHARMRMHTALHLLSAVLPYPVTGGSVGEAESRLDFDIPEAGLDKDAITAKLAEMIAADAAVTSRWITDAELEANPGLVKTMSVKPPMGTGRVRLIEIAGLDLQPCGGTHVAQHRRDRRGAGDPGREEGQIEPPRAAGVGVGLHLSESETTQCPIPARLQARTSSPPTGSPPAWASPRSASSTARSTCRRSSATPRRSISPAIFPGAVFFDIDAIADHSTDLPHMLPGATQFSKEVGALGIGKRRHHRGL